MIGFCNPLAQYLAHKDEIDAAIHRVLDSGRYILGEEVAAFEREFTAYLNVGFAVGCASGTDALQLALRALDIGPGDEVIAPSMTATATIAAIVQAGATPVFVDIEEDYYTLDPRLIEDAITPHTKAIMPVHLYGQAADMPAIMDIARRYDLKVVEDCAQATGATYRGKRLGSIGDVGCFSFFPTKNLGAIGDGGAAVTDDPELAGRLRRLRQYGWDDNRISQEPGINSRLDELQAAILRIKLPHLDEDNRRRRRLAAYYTENLPGEALQVPASREHTEHVFHLYVVRSSRRRELMDHLRTQGIHAGIHYPTPVHLQPAYKTHARIAGPMVVTDRLANEVLSLPIYPELSGEMADRVVAAVKRAQ